MQKIRTAGISGTAGTVHPTERPAGSKIMRRKNSEYSQISGVELETKSIS